MTQKTGPYDRVGFEFTIADLEGKIPYEKLEKMKQLYQSAFKVTGFRKDLIWIRVVELISALYEKDRILHELSSHKSPILNGLQKSREDLAAKAQEAFEEFYQKSPLSLFCKK